VLLPQNFGFLRPQPHCAGGALRRRHRVGTWLLLGVLVAFAGCATFGRRGPAAEKAAACRDLSRQGISAMEMGQWQRAELLLQQALEASPEDADAHRYLAEALWHRGDAQNALAEMAAATRSRPADATLAVRAGEMELATGDRDKALVHAEQAIRLDPRLAAAWTLRGRVFWQLQQPDRALADMQRALEIAPGSADVLLDVAVMYRDRGQLTRCLTTLQHLHENYSPNEAPQSALLLEGLTLLDLGRPHQACDAFLAATKRGTPNPQILYYLAQAQYAAGRPLEATAAAQQALAIDATHEASRELLAQLAAHSPPAEPQRR
jgi:tetratricopeptide (TPR) repeat protein